MNADPVKHDGSPLQVAGNARSRLALLVLIAVPWSYVCIILSVVAHEIIGHGLVALAVNGEFDGFAVMPDGMGWASATGGDHPCVMLTGGIVTTTLLGAAALAVVMSRRLVGQPLTRMLLIVLALMMLLEGLPYLFWNSLVPRPPGDVAQVFAIAPPSAVVRWTLVAVSGVAMASSVWLGSLALWRAIEGIIGAMTRRLRVTVAVVAIAAPGVAYNLSFDWNQIIDGVGYTPSIVNAILHVGAAIGIIRFRSGAALPVDVRGRTMWGAAIAMWVLAAAVLAVVIGWTQHGISWM